MLAPSLTTAGDRGGLAATRRRAPAARLRGGRGRARSVPPGGDAAAGRGGAGGAVAGRGAVHARGHPCRARRGGRERGVARRRRSNPPARPRRRGPPWRSPPGSTRPRCCAMSAGSPGRRRLPLGTGAAQPGDPSWRAAGFVTLARAQAGSGMPGEAARSLRAAAAEIRRVPTICSARMWRWSARPGAARARGGRPVDAQGSPAPAAVRRAPVSYAASVLAGFVAAAASCSDADGLAERERSQGRSRGG